MGPRCNVAASLGMYTEETEAARVGAGNPPHRRGWCDD
jgi:hypothetical protein